MQHVYVSDEQLLQGLKSGDKTSFIQIYELYWYKVFQVAYKRLKRKEIAEELTQNLFLKLWEKRNQFKINTLENYLYVSIKHAVIDHIQANLVADKYTEYYKAYSAIDDEATRNAVEFDDLSEAINKGLMLLPAKTQTVFRLNRLDHWPVEKIARHMDLSGKTVGYHLTKSLKFMKAYLKEFMLMSFCCIYF